MDYIFSPLSGLDNKNTQIEIRLMDGRLFFLDRVRFVRSMITEIFEKYVEMMVVFFGLD